MPVQVEARIEALTSESQEPSLEGIFAQFGFAIVLDRLTSKPTLLHMRVTHDNVLGYYILGGDGRDYFIESDKAQDYFLAMLTCQDKELKQVEQSLYASFDQIANAAF